MDTIGGIGEWPRRALCGGDGEEKREDQEEDGNESGLGASHGVGAGVGRGGRGRELTQEVVEGWWIGGRSTALGCCCLQLVLASGAGGLGLCLWGLTARSCALAETRSRERSWS